MPKTFVIIDGSSLVHRAFYALPLLTTANGQYTNAVYGFTTMLVKLLDDSKPDAMAVAFDKSRVTFRTKEYAAYKGQRKATPKELSEQFPVIQEVVRAFGIQVLEEEGYEADDIIGTLSVQAAQADFAVTIVTGDRDALQLINSKVKVMLTKKGITEMQVMDDQAVLEKYGITPLQVIDLKGLMGDTSDNIPGVPGVGEKTAVKLLKQFHSVENVLEHIDEVSGTRLQENLRLHADLARLSKKLATIVCDMPLKFNLQDYTFCRDNAKLKELFTNLEFKSLLAKISAQDEERPACMEQGEVKPAVLCTALGEAEKIASAIREQGLLEAYPVIIGHVPVNHIKGIAVAYNGSAVYIPQDCEAWREVEIWLADEKIRKVTHDAKNLYNLCRKLGLTLKNVVFDTMLAAYLLEPTAAKYTPEYLQKQYATCQTAWQDDPHSPEYAAGAVTLIHEIYPVLLDKLTITGLVRLYNEIEIPLIEVLSSMETAGITVDKERLETMSEQLSGRIECLLTDIYGLAAEEFNVNSPRQLGSILFEKLHLPVIKKTKTGYSTDAEVLEKLAGEHPIIDKLLEYRMLTKLKSTYLDGLQGLIDPQTGRIHTSFNQTVTATGRLSSSEPNLQNIPIRTEAGKKIREVFTPGSGWQVIMSADYSQIELRILAHISSDANLIEAFKHGQDIHTRTASEVFGVSMEEVTAEMRSRAKAVNFGIVYGISDYGLSRDIGVSRKEAAFYIDSYFARYPGVKSYMDNTVTEAHEKGYVTTLFGRRRFLPDINSRNFNLRSFAERTAMNTPIQGAAADIIKKAMVDVYRALRHHELRSRILLQVHDELVLEVVNEEKNLVEKIVKDAMEHAVELSVPMIVDVKFGGNWAQAK